jgi:hypothetical protein
MMWTVVAPMASLGRLLQRRAIAAEHDIPGARLVTTEHPPRGPHLSPVVDRQP